MTAVLEYAQQPKKRKTRHLIDCCAQICRGRDCKKGQLSTQKMRSRRKASHTFEGHSVRLRVVPKHNPTTTQHQQHQRKQKQNKKQRQTQHQPQQEDEPGCRVGSAPPASSAMSSRNADTSPLIWLVEECAYGVFVRQLTANEQPAAQQQRHERSITDRQLDRETACS